MPNRTWLASTWTLPSARWAVVVAMLGGGCIRVPDAEPTRPSTELAVAWPGGEADESEFTPLFNGQNLDGWKADPEAKFAVTDGAIVIEAGQGLLRTEKAYRDFELRAEFRLPVAGADSGIFFRIIEPTRYQVQTKDADDLGEIRSGKVTQAHDRAATARLRKPVGEWQQFDVLVRGGECWVKLNGELVTYATGLAETSGPIGLQAEGFPVEFQQLRVRNVK